MAYLKKDIVLFDEKDSSLLMTPLDELDTPLLQFMDTLIHTAIHQGISDLHFEPFEKHFRIRARQDGLLYEIYKFPLKMAARIISRLKIMAQLDIAEQRLPQDGRFKQNLSSNSDTFAKTPETIIDCRVSTCPTLFGEKIVLRLQSSTLQDCHLDNLGLEPFQKAVLLTTLHKPQGMILVTGPTGSGKTITLYSAIDHLNTLERNISSCEDPVELYFSGINQVPVNLKMGLTFAKILRAFLRQDPDIIMVGEIRDLETAEIALKAAETGHLVLSTLHTNSAADSLSRLINMGIPPYLVASSLSLVIAQRLLRKLCLICREQQPFSLELLLQAGFSEEVIVSLMQEIQKKSMKTITYYKAIGCEHCKQGYRGRTGIFELMSLSNELRARLSPAQIESPQLLFDAPETHWNLRKAALYKILKGITTIEEVLRVID